MPGDPRDAIKAELRELIDRAIEIYDDERDWVGGVLQAENAHEDKLPARKADFNQRYHRWYSSALCVVRQLAPERADEFELYFRNPKSSNLKLSLYTIQEHIGGLIPYGQKQSSYARQALVKFAGQIAILQAIDERIDSVLADVQGVLQAALFDTEISVARELATKQHLRAAGAVAGVVLERHLGEVAAAHSLSLRKKNPTIGDLNEALKKEGVYDLPAYRRIQHLADLRNIAVHHKDREPTAEETTDLIDGVDRIIKTVF